MSGPTGVSNMQPVSYHNPANHTGEAKGNHEIETNYFQDTGKSLEFVKDGGTELDLALRLTRELCDKYGEYVTSKKLPPKASGLNVSNDKGSGSNDGVNPPPGKNGLVSNLDSDDQYCHYYTDLINKIGRTAAEKKFLEEVEEAIEQGGGDPSMYGLLNADTIHQIAQANGLSDEDAQYLTNQFEQQRVIKNNSKAQDFLDAIQNMQMNGINLTDVLYKMMHGGNFSGSDGFKEIVALAKIESLIKKDGLSWQAAEQLLGTQSSKGSTWSYHVKEDGGNGGDGGDGGDGGNSGNGGNPGNGNTSDTTPYGYTPPPPPDMIFDMTGSDVMQQYEELMNQEMQGSNYRMGVTGQQNLADEQRKADLTYAAAMLQNAISQDTDTKAGDSSVTVPQAVLDMLKKWGVSGGSASLTKIAANQLLADVNNGASQSGISAQGYQSQEQKLMQDYTEAVQGKSNMLNMRQGLANTIIDNTTRKAQ